MAMSGGWGQWLGLWLAGRMGSPAFLRLSLDTSDDPVSIRKQSMGSLKLRLARSAREFICLTPALAERCREVGIPQERIRLIPNAVDLLTFRLPNDSEKSETRARLSVPEGWKVAIFLGGLVERKGILELIDVWEKVGRTHPRSLLMLCGPSVPGPVGSISHSYLEKIRKRIDTHGLRGRVRLTGRLSESEVRDHLWSADVYVTMSRAEGLANSILEAMAVGLPVLTLSKPGDLDGVITDGRDGWLVDPGAVPVFLRTLEEALGNPDRLARMGAAARKRIEESFSLDAKIEAYRALLIKHGAITDNSDGR
jgi:glycosyltransferase involved in cell wall biosynthesis